MNWTSIKHPDFDKATVQVGGIKPGYDYIPDIKTCLAKSKMFSQFIDKAILKQPAISIKNKSLSKVGNSVYKLSFSIFNEKDVPTAPKIGQHTRKAYPINISLKLPNGWEVYNGHTRVQSGHLNPGESKKLEWTIIKKTNEEGTISVNLQCPHLHDVNFKLEAK